MRVVCWRCKDKFDNDLIDTAVSVGTCPRCYQELTAKHRPEAEAELRAESERIAKGEEGPEPERPFTRMALTAPANGKKGEFVVELERSDDLQDKFFTPETFTQAAAYLIHALYKGLGKDDMLAMWTPLKEAAAKALLTFIPKDAGMTMESVSTILDAVLFIFLREEKPEAAVEAPSKSAAA